MTRTAPRAVKKVAKKRHPYPGEHGEWRWAMPSAGAEGAEGAHPQDVSAFGAFGVAGEHLRRAFPGAAVRGDGSGGHGE